MAGRGFKRYKYRCYEQVRVAYNGMGCEWSHNYFRDEMQARADIPDNSRRTEENSYEEVEDFRRTGMDSWGRMGIRNGEGMVFTPWFEEEAVIENLWHRKRSDRCVNAPLDDDEWADSEDWS